MSKWKQAAKAACAAALHYSGARRAMAGAARFANGGRRTLILAYHRVVPDFAAEAEAAIPGLLVSASTFERHILELRKADYQITSLDEALEVNAGIRRAKRDLAVITFDDGYRDNYQVAFPILKKLEVPATVYLATSFVGSERSFSHDRLYALLSRPEARHVVSRVAAPLGLQFDGESSQVVERLIAQWPAAQLDRFVDGMERELGEPLARTSQVLNWDECRTMARSGLISFGAHTVNHVPLHREPAPDVEREIRESRLTIERELGVPCRDFAYPNGYYSRPIIRALVRSGFRSAVTTYDAMNSIGGDPFTLRRKTVWENHSRGFANSFSPSLLACQLDGVFGMLGLQKPVDGECTA